MLDRLLKRMRLRDAGPVELSEEDFRELLDKQVRESLNMSLSDFRARLADGTLDPEAPRVARIAILVGARAS